MGRPEQIVECPTCGRLIAWTDEQPYRPFCSERCKMVDLGAWFSEERSIPGEDEADAGKSPKKREH